MKSNLLKLLAITAFTLQVGIASAQTVQVKENGGLKIRRIDLFFQLPNPNPNSTTDPNPKWEPAAENYYVPADVESLKYEIQLMDPKIETIKSRLEIRQVCSVRDTPDTGVAQELEILATETAAGDTPIIRTDGKFVVIIKVHKPDTKLVHKFKHCFGDGDHLGEGPHQTLFSLRSADSSFAANETPHVAYSRAFETIRQDTFNRLRATDFVNSFRSAVQPTNKKSKRRSSH